MIFTPLPLDSFEASAEVLTDGDVRRARINTLRLVEVANGERPFHKGPFRELWRYHHLQLIRYGVVMDVEWQHRRGFGPSVVPRLKSYINYYDRNTPNPRPAWMGDPRLHRSHRSFLLHRSLKKYAAHNWNETPSPNLWFPSNGSRNRHNAPRED